MKTPNTDPRKTALRATAVRDAARRARPWLKLVASAALLAGCASPPPPAPAPQPAPPAPARPPAPAPAPGMAPAPAAPAAPRTSDARTPRDYRRDGAAHVYATYADRIYKGMLQPNLYAIGVLEIDLDRQGRVSALRWMRRPTHAPEVVTEIERLVRAAAPFPAPARMGRVTYTDVWLWDKSGKFQLDTLTEGQL